MSKQERRFLQLAANARQCALRREHAGLLIPAARERRRALEFMRLAKLAKLGQIHT